MNRYDPSGLESPAIAERDSELAEMKKDLQIGLAVEAALDGATGAAEMEGLGAVAGTALTTLDAGVAGGKGLYVIGALRRTYDEYEDDETIQDPTKDFNPPTTLEQAWKKHPMGRR